MKIIKHDPASAIPSHAPIMIGDVANQVLVGEVDSAQVRISSVTFRDGARNRFHRHSADQILVITHGEGVIATPGQSYEVEAGDVVIIPAGELHWHGAGEGQEMTQLSIVVPHETTVEEPDGVIADATMAVGR
jgi:quercetin dioxygenase-like cupin family protein